MRLKIRIQKLFFLLMIAAFVSGAVVYFKMQSKAAADKLFGNMTYVTSETAPWPESATLVDGQYEWNESFFYYRLQYDGRYVFGDFNRDGLKDAAAIMIEYSGGNQDWYLLAFLINDGKKLVHKASRPLDDRAIIKSLKIKNHKVIVDMYVHREWDSMGGPTRRVKNIYDYQSPSLDIVAPLWAP